MNLTHTISNHNPKIQFQQIQPLTITSKILSFQPRNNSRNHNNKSKSNSRKHNNHNKNILTPCQPLTQKLMKLNGQKNVNLKKINHLNHRRQKTQEHNNVLHSSHLFTENQNININVNNQQKCQIYQKQKQKQKQKQREYCINHPDKKGEYFIQNYPNKKFCLKCNLILSNGNNSMFLNKQSNLYNYIYIYYNIESHKKQSLDLFKTNLTSYSTLIQSHTSSIISSIKQSQQKYSHHLNYINQSFTLLSQTIQQKRRQLINNLIISQQKLKQQFQNNFKKLKKIQKSLDKYELDIQKFYDQIIEELPKEQFDKIMKQYEKKVQSNVKNKVQSIMIKDEINVYLPLLEIQKIINKSNVEYYQPIIFDQTQDKSKSNSSKKIKMSTSNIFSKDISNFIIDTQNNHRQSNQQKIKDNDIFNKQKKLHIGRKSKIILNQEEDKQNNINYPNIQNVNLIQSNGNNKYQKFNKCL